MNFEKKLNEYINILNCSAKEFSDISGISTSLISKYRNGSRKPKIDSEQFFWLVNGIYSIAKSKKINLEKEDIKKSLEDTLIINNFDFEIFRKNFNYLVSELDISIIDFSNTLQCDTSFIYRIKSGSRKPANITKFVDDFCSYVVSHNQSTNKKISIAKILKADLKDLDNKDKYKGLLTEWIYYNTVASNDIANNFLRIIDDFNSNDYTNIIKSNQKYIPTSPIKIHRNKIYYGIDEMKNAESDFIKITLLSKSTERLFLYNEMPMQEISDDAELQKKWFLAISMLLKKGIHLDIIHNINRPTEEMLLGLKCWIPIYMTGSITPYYFDKPISDIYSHMHCTSGQIALVGECPEGQENKCKLYISTKKDELDYYKEKSNFLLSKAKPLMNIYKESDNDKFDVFLNNEKEKYKVKKIKKDVFNNIDFTVCENRWVIINKNNYPQMHFVIRNNRLRKSIEHFLFNS